jgi:hypothetical protein
MLFFSREDTQKIQNTLNLFGPRAMTPSIFHKTQYDLGDDVAQWCVDNV